MTAAIWLLTIVVTGTAGFWLVRSALPRWGGGGGHLSRLRSHLHRSTRRLLCKESVRLTPQHTLHLVEWEGRTFVVACHPSGATLMPDPAAAPAAQASAAGACAGLDQRGLH